MTSIDRRTLLKTILPGAVVTAAGATAMVTLGVSLVSPGAAHATPLALDKINPLSVDDLVQKAQVVVVPPPRRRRRRRRRWVCWWHRGRRVCGWRWV